MTTLFRRIGATLPMPGACCSDSCRAKCCTQSEACRAVQGNGEVCVTAIECPMDRVELTFDVLDDMPLEPNCVYVIPPSRDMALSGGRLHLLEPSEPRGQRLPIDYFFRSLADDLMELSIGVILSGMGSDGMLGLRAIKEIGGGAS